MAKIMIVIALVVALAPKMQLFSYPDAKTVRQPLPKWEHV
jgi:hypothetical protein